MGNNFVNLSLWLDFETNFQPLALYADLKKIRVINILSRLIVFFKINFLSVVLLRSANRDLYVYCVYCN